MRVRTLVPAALLLGGCTATSDPVTTQGTHFQDLWSIFLPIAVGVVLLIWGLVVFSVIRYRRRSDEVIPDQRQYVVPLEVAYTAIPLLVVAGLFALSVAAEQHITRVRDHPDETVTVVGFQWSWEFRYADHDIVVAGRPGAPPLLVLPRDRTTQLDLVADDVIHSFWVPEFLSKRDLIPGIDNHIDITPTTDGTWVGHCAEFCGLDHWRMNFEVEVVPPDLYDRWVSAAQAAGDPYSIPRPEEL